MRTTSEITVAEERASERPYAFGPPPLNVQLDAGSNFVCSTGLENLDEPQVLLPFGTSFRLTESLCLRVGFSEDLTQEAIPDLLIYSGILRGNP